MAQDHKTSKDTSSSNSPNEPPKKAGVDISLTSVMDYIKGEEIDPNVLKEYSRLLRNFKSNFVGFLSMTAYKQMSRLSRLLDQLEKIEERLYMDYDQVLNAKEHSVANRDENGQAIGDVNGAENIQGVSESSEERLLAMSHRITTQVQNTLGFLMTLLDRIENKEVPDKIDMIQQNKALPESNKIQGNKLDAQGRKRIRDVIKELEGALPEEGKPTP